MEPPIPQKRNITPHPGSWRFANRLPPSEVLGIRNCCTSTFEKNTLPLTQWLRTTDPTSGVFSSRLGPNISLSCPACLLAREVSNGRQMYWATKCTRCSGMVGYRDVGYVLSIDGMRAEEELPVGTMRLRCDHCGTVSDFNLQNLHPTSIKLVVPRLP